MADDQGIKLELKRVDLQEWVKLDEMLGMAPLFTAMGPASTSLLLSKATTRRYQPGELVFQEGTPGNSLFMVLRGEVALGRGNGDKAVEICTVRKADFFGEGEVLGPEVNRSYSATAVGQADLAEFAYADIYAMSKKHFQVYGLLRETRDARAKANDELNDFLDRW
ncbi:MAG: cyclic nucleotide-binding domain-containing protein [Myxococcales bacterium]